MPEELLQRLRGLAAQKRIPSVNAAVREALERYVAALERDDFRLEMEAAARDPLFLRDVDTLTAAFRRADEETAAMIPEW